MYYNILLPKKHFLTMSINFCVIIEWYFLCFFTHYYATWIYNIFLINGNVLLSLAIIHISKKINKDETNQTMQSSIRHWEIWEATSNLNFFLKHLPCFFQYSRLCFHFQPSQYLKVPSPDVGLLCLQVPATQNSKMLSKNK